MKSLSRPIKNIFTAIISIGLFVSCTPEAPNWKSEEQALMKEHLYGEVLPYISDSEVTLDEDMIVIKGKEVNSDDLVAYASKYKDWKDYSKDYVSQYGDYFYAFEKVIKTSEGKRAILVQFSAVNDKGFISPTGNGTLLLTALDPYLHEFPSDKLSDAVKNLFGSDVTIPVFEADYYQTTSSNTGVYCFIDSNSEDAGYSEILTNNGWTIDTARDASGYIVAISPDDLFSLSYLYNQEYRSLDIHLNYRPYIVWPTLLISNAFIKAGTTEYKIPTLEKEGYRYNFYNFGGSIRVGVYTVDREDFDLYLGELEEDDWTVRGPDQYGNFYCQKELKELNGIANMCIYYSKGDVSIEMDLFLEPIKTTVWPKEDITTLFNKYTKYGSYEFDFPTLEVEGALYYVYENPTNDSAISYGAYSYVYGAVVVSNITNKDISDYIGLLAANSFIKGETEKGVTFYTKTLENGATAKLGVSITTNNEFVIAFYLIPTPKASNVWPTEKVKALVPYCTDEIPAYTGKASDYKVYDDAFGKTIVVFVRKGTEKASQDTYRFILEENGWKQVSYEESLSTYIYVSPNKELYIETLIIDEGTFTINITEAPSSWSTFRINDMLNKLNSNITDLVPECVGGPLFSYKSYDGGTSDYSYVYAEIIGEQEAITEFTTNYIKAIKEAGWTLKDGYYYSPNNELSTEIATRGEKTYVVIYIEL